MILSLTQRRYLFIVLAICCQLSMQSQKSYTSTPLAIQTYNKVNAHYSFQYLYILLR